MASIEKFITGEDVWATLQELAKSARGQQKFVATGYLGDGAGDLLELGRGDVLAVALSKANAKNGSVSPKEIRRLQKRGVEVCVDARLHAKVYLFGKTLVVGSANLSKHSKSTLHEACFVSRDRLAIRRVQAWFRGLRVTPVTPTWLDACLAVYKPPRFLGSSEAGAKIEGRYWLVGIHEMDFPEEEAEECLAGQQEAEAKARAGHEVETLRFGGSLSLFTREGKPGDLVIQVWDNGRSRDVYPHARVVGIRRIKGRRGTPVVYVYVEMVAEPNLVSWAKFKRGMAAVGVSLGREVSAREITGQRAMDQTRTLMG